MVLRELAREVLREQVYLRWSTLSDFPNVSKKLFGMEVSLNVGLFKRDDLRTELMHDIQLRQSMKP